MKRRQALAFAGVAALAGLAGTGVGVWRQPDAPTGQPGEVPANFWALRFARPEGGELGLADFRGQALLLNFWAPWCPPCVRELPLLEQFTQAQAPRGLRTLALAVDGAAAVREFLQRQPLTLPVGLAGLDGSELSRQLGNAQGGLPYTVLLDAKGRMVQRRLGETHRAELDQWMSALPIPQ